MLETVRCPPDRQLVLFHFFLKIVRIIAILTPKSLRKDTVQTSEQHLMSVFFSRSAIWSESFSLLRNHLKCRFCQKIASHLRRMSGAALGHGDTICDDGRVWKAIIEALLLCPKHLLLSALQKRLRNQGIQNNLSCETFQNVTLQLLFFQRGLNSYGAKRAKRRSAFEYKHWEDGGPSFFMIW